MTTTAGPVMVIGAHPDDADFLAGGTVARLIQEGHEITYVVVTNGNKGSGDRSGPLAVAKDPAGVRAALRKLGVERIVATADETGWTFEGLCNLSKLVSNKGLSAPPSPPRSATPRHSRGVPRLP